MTVDRAAILGNLRSAYGQLLKDRGSTSISLFCGVLDEAYAMGFTRQEIEDAIFRNRESGSLRELPPPEGQAVYP